MILPQTSPKGKLKKFSVMTADFAPSERESEKSIEFNKEFNAGSGVEEDLKQNIKNQLEA